MSRTIRRTLPIALACAALLAACGSDAKTSTGGGGTSPATSPAAEVDTSQCAKADGSSPKVQEFTTEPPICLVNGKTYKATIVTTQGTLHVLLRADIAPNTVNSFVNLARYHYFDNTTCHRAIKNFVVQCGDPTATGGGGPGYEFDDELGKIEPYRIGSVAMANAGPNTNGSQFFIITGDDGAALPPNYTLFGQVEDNDLAVVTALDAVANPNDGPPLVKIDITSVTIDES